VKYPQLEENPRINSEATVPIPSTDINRQASDVPVSSSLDTSSPAS